MQTDRSPYTRYHLGLPDGRRIDVPRGCGRLTQKLGLTIPWTVLLQATEVIQDWHAGPGHVAIDVLRLVRMALLPRMNASARWPIGADQPDSTGLSPAPGRR